MKTIKPGALSLLTRVIEHRGRCFFVVSPLLFVSFSEGIRLKSEVALWKFAAEQLGKDAAVDAGFPKGVPEFLVHGEAFAPGGTACGQCKVRARFADREKTLYAFGDRRWNGRVMTPPEPFTRMPLDWSRAFGGPGFAANPGGIGAAESGERAGVLPNLEYPEPRLLHPDQRVPPAAFGPRNIAHPERAAFAGTYDEAWLTDHFPGFPPDLNWRLFNVAPQDQWLAGELDGTEAWEFENLTSHAPIVQGRLPGFTVRCFIRRADAGKTALEEIRLRLDTVWFFPEQASAILVERGLAQVMEDDAADLDLLLAGVEWTDGRRAAAHYRRALDLRLDAENGHFYLLQEEDLLPEGIGRRYGVERIIDGPIESPDLLQANLRKRQLREIEEARATVREFGLDPDEGHGPALPETTSTPPTTVEELPGYMAKMQRRRDQLSAEQAAREASLDQERRAALSRAGIDYGLIEAEMNAKPKGPPQFSAQAELHFLEQLRTTVAQQQGPVDEIDAYLNDPDLRQRLTDAERQSREGYRLSAHRQGPADPMGAERAAEVRERVTQGYERGESFADADLTGADLSQLNLAGADFSGAFLERANLRGTKLAGADFTNAVLTRADLTNALFLGVRLENANLGGARCTQTQFYEACLDGVILSGADLRMANFMRASLIRVDLSGGALFSLTDWSEAVAQDLNLIDLNLQGLILRGTNLERGVFVRCRFDGVDFTGAQLARAVFLEAKGKGAKFDQAAFAGAAFVGGADLREADFHDASILTTVLRKSDLTAARFDRASLKEVDLSECLLSGASFVMASATQSRFDRADLSQTRFTSANLMGSSLQKSTIVGADFRRANLYGADFARVIQDQTTDLSDALTHKRRIYPKRRRAGSTI